MWLPILIKYQGTWTYRHGGEWEARGQQARAEGDGQARGTCAEAGHVRPWARGARDREGQEQDIQEI